MKFFHVILIICCYIISQTITEARVTGPSKNYWPLPVNGDYPGDSYHQKFESKRQAGWGKRRDLASEDDDSELPPYHPYAAFHNSGRTWFDYE
ncbi:unnamed protein product [Adineta steineri]|uniref:Uncharacterized protein n=1 Tax=Adineta steineri TaxID=433720 RepID=A0A818JXF6_9BILA|nr:unnamed protein product [Adineta steineri]CAF1135309.1 unnamed protein product [Adineta steineri]CAF1150943.1 unnamed protein product [Adineta steineri]CAF1447985.1 unnamed protein product [Adineta steineri]CAF1518585.1 unnamed protein product [Adineta steineri]